MEVTSVEIIPSELKLKVGDTYSEFNVIVCPREAENKSIVWSTRQSDIISFNEETETVFAIAPGYAKLVARSADNSSCYDVCVITVEGVAPISSIEMPNIIMKKGEVRPLDIYITPSSYTVDDLTLTSSNPKAVTVTADGWIMAKNLGRAMITATAKDGDVKETCLVIVSGSDVATPEDEENKAPENEVQDPIDVHSGAHVIKHSLMKLYGGQSLELVAHYNSTRLVKGVLGAGWYHNYEKKIVIDGSRAYVYESPSSYSEYTATEYDCDACGNKLDANEFECNSPGKQGYVLRVTSSSSYPYVLDCNSARKEYYNSDKKLAKVLSHDGFETIITYTSTRDTISDNVTGKKIYLAKNSKGLVTRIYDDAEREVEINQDSNDCLTSFKDINGNTITYTYDIDGRVLTGTDANDTCYFTNTYDECGRVVQQKDGIAGSTTSKINYECGEREVTVDCGCGDEETITEYYDNGTRASTNRVGKTSSREYNDKGLLVKYIDENGNAKCYEYDDNYNITKETDAKGNSVVKTYNTFNKPTSITDKNGNTTSIEYDTRGNVIRIRYPAVNGVVPEETYTYNSRNQMLSHTDIRGTVTVFTYNTSGLPATKKVGAKPAINYVYSNGLLTEQTDAMGNTTRYAYNTIGQMISKTDALNHVTEYTYDGMGNLLRVTDANDNSIETEYDVNGQKKTVTDAKGNTTSYAYNGNLKNTSVTLPDGNSITYEYDGEDRLVKITDQAGKVSSMVYDSAGRVTKKIMADGATVEYDYDTVGNVLREINPKSGVVTKTYDKMGNVLTLKDNAGNTTHYQYNAFSKVIRAVNASGGATVYEYSKAGDLLSETDPLNNKKEYTYDAYGNRLTAKDAKGNVTTFTYDHNNNLLTVKDAKNNVTTYTYNALNQLVSVKDAKNNIIRYGYDALGRRTTITDAKNNVFTSFYDANGNVVKTTDAKGNTISESTYNSLNKPLVVIDSVGKTITYTYNAIGQVASITDSMNHRQEYTYDNRGRNTTVKDALNNTSSVTYDSLGNVTSLSGPLGGTTNYTYDEMGRLTAESTVSGGNISYTYNALNLKASLTNARNQQRTFSYDAKGRIIGYTTTEDFANYTYDANDNVLTVTDDNGTTTREYDELNRITKLTDTYGKVIQYEYDAVGNLTRLVYPDNTAVTYAYDANNNLISVTDWANRTTTYSYDVNNRVVGVVKPDGSVTTTVYDEKQRITSTSEETSSGTVITGYEYTYDTLSRLVEEKDIAKSTTMCYTYDSLNRVTKRTIKNASNVVISEETYTYDAAGNITSASGENSTYDTNNRLTVFDGDTVSYDMDGNMLSFGTTSYTYDSSNRLITAGGHTYTYTAEDVRIRDLTTEDDIKYTYNTNCKLSKLLTRTKNNVVTKYVYGRGLIGEEVNSTFKTYHFDYRGSTIAITDANGTITDTFEYDTYGKVITRTGTSEVIFGYNGRDGVITEDIGLIYMRARYYSPEMRRFINADIIHGQISDSTSLNRYAYVNGNPVSFTDPFGLERTESEDDQYSNGVEVPYGSDEYWMTLAAFVSGGLEFKGDFGDLLDYAKAFELESAGVRFVKSGKFYYIFGDRKTLSKYGITQNRINTNQVGKYRGIANMASPNTIWKSGLKEAFDAPGIVLDVVGAGAEAYIEASQYEDLEDQLIVGGYTFATEMASSAISTVATVGTTAAITKACAVAGTVIAPGIGTAIGLGVGFIVGIAANALFGWLRKEYINDIVENN